MDIFVLVWLFYIIVLLSLGMAGSKSVQTRVGRDNNRQDAF